MLWPRLVKTPRVVHKSEKRSASRPAREQENASTRPQPGLALKGESPMSERSQTPGAVHPRVPNEIASWLRYSITVVVVGLLTAVTAGAAPSAPQQTPSGF